MTWRPVDLDPLAIVMVGLPARGKTFTARRIARYLGWQGYRARSFNVGDYRRKALGAGQSADFFDPDDLDAVATRERVANAAVDEMVSWLSGNGEIGILDATNSQKHRRAHVRERCEARGIQVLFVEITVTGADIVERNVRTTKVRSPDYAGRDPEEAVADFLARIAHYERVYEPVSADEGSYVRIIDLGKRVELCNIYGYLPGRLVSYLLHLHDTPRPIFLTRHGQSTFNLEDRVGGDPGLSADGAEYATRLAAWVASLPEESAPSAVWTSMLKRACITAKPLGRATRSWKLLDEIDAGECDGMTYSEIKAEMPRDAERRRTHKFTYRYPRGESYQDLIARVEPVILELERQQQPVLVVAHQAVLRAIYSYLKGTPPEECPHVDIPLHTVICLTSDAYGTVEQRIPLGP